LWPTLALHIPHKNLLAAISDSVLRPFFFYDFGTSSIPEGVKTRSIADYFAMIYAAPLLVLLHIFGGYHSGLFSQHFSRESITPCRPAT
jgi:Kef-type K+ transport system membrane component KefB